MILIVIVIEAIGLCVYFINMFLTWGLHFLDRIMTVIVGGWLGPLNYFNLAYRYFNKVPTLSHEIKLFYICAFGVSILTVF